MKIKIDDVINYYEQNYSILEISKILNCSISTITRELKKNNISLRKKKIDKDKLEELYKSGLIVSDIAKYFNCSIDTIRKRIKKYNIKLKTEKIKIDPIKGQKFNRLEFIEEDIPQHNKKYWICKCECGKIKSYDYYSVLKGNTKSCGCFQKDKVKNYNWTGYKNIPGKYWNQLIKNAMKRNIDFNLTLEYAWNLYENQNKKCKLSELPIEFETKNNKIENFQASLDRIDNNIGYVEGNVQWIVKEINYMKNKINENDFIKLCKLISNNKK